jgi:hypothetical protein
VADLQEASAGPYSRGSNSTRFQNKYFYLWACVFVDLYLLFRYSQKIKNVPTRLTNGRRTGKLGKRRYVVFTDCYQIRQICLRFFSCSLTKFFKIILFLKKSYKSFLLHRDLCQIILISCENKSADLQSAPVIFPFLIILRPV